MRTRTIGRLLKQLTKQSLARNYTATLGIKGKAQLITGNFSYLTKPEITTIQSGLQKGKVFVLVYDRDSITVPANERAMWIRDYFKDHANLEVRVAYGPPSEKDASKKQFTSYIKKQIPSSLQISSVGCNHFYSEELASEFKVSYKTSNSLNEIKHIDDAIKHDPAAHEHLLLPIVAKRVISPFKKVIEPDSFMKLCESEKYKVKNDIQKLNPNHPNPQTFFQRTQWNTADLNRVNLPIIIGKIEDHQQQLAFSHRMNTQVFDMPIYMPHQGWRIPEELSPYKALFARIIAAESIANPAIGECNAYVTIDSGIVFPNGYARRGGLHVDGFLTHANARAGKDGIVWGDNTYIVSDAKELQTELYPGPFDLSHVNLDDPQAVLKTFEIQGSQMPFKQCNPYDIVRLTTNNVHAVHPNLTQEYIQRSFFKMTFSERLFNRGGNTINPNLNYRFIYVPRSNDRNTQNFIGVPPVGFQDVDLREIDFSNAKFPEWVTPTPIQVSKKHDVRITAKPAIEGEILETKVNGQVVTTNVARAGDIKVIRAKDDCYFLSATHFKTLYEATQKKDSYAPKQRVLNALLVNRNITFPAPWGTRQNIPAGGCVIQDTNHELWGVHQDSFEATYQINRR